MVALGAGVGVMMGVVRGNIFLWILIGAVAGLALVWPEDARATLSRQRRTGPACRTGLTRKPPAAAVATRAGAIQWLRQPFRHRASAVSHGCCVGRGGG